jgi:diguanylate cyclase
MTAREGDFAGLLINQLHISAPACLTRLFGAKKDFRLRMGHQALLDPTYDGWLVVASLLMAVLASYTALDIAERVVAAESRIARRWLSGGSVAMGVGIWCSHFLGMLAFRMPGHAGYDPAIAAFSLLIAIASSAFALWVVCQTELSWLRLGFGAVVLGAGVCAMHYSGLAAWRMTPEIQYLPSRSILSVVIAIAASATGLKIAFYLRQRPSRFGLHKVAAAVVLGSAIGGIHYTGMAAMRFAANSTSRMVSSAINPEWTAVLIIMFGLAVLSIALIASVFDSRLESRTAVLASSLVKAHRELQFLALHDSLTKLPNRAMLADRLDREIQKARRDKGRFSVLLLDLDGFKEVNDAFGHPTGDLLLVELAARIRSSIRSHDTLARMGGDEFVLLADAVEPADAAMLADKLVTAIRNPFLIDGNELRVTGSIGIAVYSGKEREQDELLKNADAAMYQAKASGRNCYCFFEASMNVDAHEHLQMIYDLRRAQSRQELTLHYQPKFEAAQGKLIGAEALLRWNHPSRGSLPPDQFIPLAEKSGLIVPLGTWVLNEACRQMSEWHAAGHRDWTISVNISAVQFTHLGLVNMVRGALEQHALEPRFLTLEITESTAMRDADAGMVILEQLHAMGVRISIDDFGTGYSSLLYLKRLPVTELKIDRGFVRDLPQDAEDSAIVGAIVALGRTLNLEIVAEGVETSEQREFLTGLGCNVLQGFLVGRPMPADRFLQAAKADAELRWRPARPISLMTA